MAAKCTITSTRNGLVATVEVDDIEGVMLAAERAADAEYASGQTGVIRVRAVANFPSRGGADHGSDTYIVECKRGASWTC